MRCLTGCGKEVIFHIDQEFCPNCYESYLQNLKDIMPRSEEENRIINEINQNLKNRKDKD